MAAILLIDDDVDFCDVTKRMLTKAGYEVKAINDLRRSLDCIEKRKPYSAIIVDFWMGGLDTVPVLDAIAEKMPDVPVVLISGGGGKLSIESTKAIGEVSGTVRFLQKPFRKDELLDVLSSVVR
jgi:DNA-binding NtrC family response regulator